jgi:hypothetical protein
MDVKNTPAFEPACGHTWQVLHAVPVERVIDRHELREMFHEKGRPRAARRDHEVAWNIATGKMMIQ